MARKPMYDGGTKNKMIEVASKMFFENGFDGTSVRSIMRGVGGEIITISRKTICLPTLWSTFLNRIKRISSVLLRKHGKSRIKDCFGFLCM